jgi:hypothetical protein
MKRVDRELKGSDKRVLRELRIRKSWLFLSRSYGKLLKNCINKNHTLVVKHRCMLAGTSWLKDRH